MSTPDRRDNLETNTFSVDRSKYRCDAFSLPSLVSYVDIFRTLRSFFKGSFCIPLGFAFSFEVELVAIIHKVLYATTFMWKRHLLESNSAYMVFSFCTRSLLVPKIWYFAWVDFLEMIDHMDFYYSHIFGRITLQLIV